MGKKLKTPSVDGLEISYTKYGKGNSLILFIHGWSCDESYWKNQIEFFKSNFQVVTIDLGGHGNSGINRKNWTMSSFGDDLVSVVNQLDFQNLYLVGHSMGGMVALDATSKIDNKKISIFLVDQLKRKYWPVPEEKVQVFLKPFREKFKEHTKTWVINDDNFVKDSDPELIEWISTDMANAPPEVAIASIYDALTRNFDETVEELRNRNIEMTLINNKDCEEESKQELKQLGFRIEIIPKVGHFMILEKPKEFNEKLFELIKYK